MDPKIQQSTNYTLWNFYEDFWKPFGELLTNMEHEGFFVDRCAFPWLCWHSLPAARTPVLNARYTPLSSW